MTDQPPLLSIERGTSASLVKRIMDVLLPDAETVLDMTYGNGKFWPATGFWSTDPFAVTAMDLNPQRAPHLVADFRELPFLDGSFDVAVFDPPFLTETSPKSLMGQRFGNYPTLGVLKVAVQRGLQEAWRVSKVGVIVKCQNYIHSQTAVWMDTWIRDSMRHRAAGVEPYGEVHQENRKLVDPKWVQQLSVWSSHSTYLVFRHGSQRHVKRGK